MNRQTFARTLSASLTRAEWGHDALCDILIRRLPSPMQHHAPDIAAHLLTTLPLLYAPSQKACASALRTAAAFEPVFRHCTKHAAWPDPDLTPQRMTPTAAFADIALPNLPTTGSLADWLMLSPQRLDHLADRQGRHEAHEETAVNNYHYRSVHKAVGQRLIEAPKAGLKAVQRKVLSDILNPLPNHPDAFGFVSGRNCVQAANRHVGEGVVLRFDLAEFFPSIGAGRVYGLFRCMGYPHSVAQMLTGLCTNATPARVLERLPFAQRLTYRPPHLPQGAPTSPALANHLSFGLDRRLSALARTLGANYSRYADDLAFSGPRAITATLLRAVPEIVREEGFALNPAKSRIQSATSRQSVTGIVVNAHLNLDRRQFDQLKAVIHTCGKPDDTRLRDPAFCRALLGRLDWVAALNPHRAEKLRRLLERAVVQQA